MWWPDFDSEITLFVGDFSQEIAMMASFWACVMLEDEDKKSRLKKILVYNRQHVKAGAKLICMQWRWCQAGGGQADSRG